MLRDELEYQRLRDQTVQTRLATGQHTAVSAFEEANKYVTLDIEFHVQRELQRMERENHWKREQEEKREVEEAAPKASLGYRS